MSKNAAFMVNICLVLFPGAAVFCFGGVQNFVGLDTVTARVITSLEILGKHCKGNKVGQMTSNLQKCGKITDV